MPGGWPSRGREFAPSAFAADPSARADGPSSSVVAYAGHGNLYLNITDRCTLRCRFCPKTRGRSDVAGVDLTLDAAPSFGAVVEAIDDPTVYEEIVFCGLGEPTRRLETLLGVAHWIKGQGGRVRVNTDGLGSLVHGHDILPSLGDCVDALSVSMNAHNEMTYVRLCDPSTPGCWRAMLDFLGAARRYVPKVTATAIEGLRGVDIEACRRLAEALGVHFRERHFDVVG